MSLQLSAKCVKVGLEEVIEMRIDPKNVRTQSMVFSVSLPLILAYQLLELAQGLNMKPSRLLARIVAKELGGDPDSLRPVGRPRMSTESKVDALRKVLGENAPSRKDLLGMYPPIGNWN